ncbi:MAG: hypothetical protein IJY27_02610 [Clostridia bacterium]|nr:hypothetical protein [Clostridia bacterium]
MLENKSLYGVMKKHFTHVRGRRLLLEGSARVLAQKVRYKMYYVEADGEKMYQLCSVYGHDRAECFVSCDRATADKIFFSLLRGRVTPCSMVYIVSELVPDTENHVLMGV